MAAIVNSRGQIIVDQTRSYMFYTPLDENGYGTLYCWGTNKAGIQKTPCAFKVVAAGPPDPVHNCTALRTSDTTLFVRCQPGQDGGLVQTFVLKLHDASTGATVRTVSRKRGKPEFFVDGLQSGKGFAVSVFATNDRGRSEPVALMASAVGGSEYPREASLPTIKVHVEMTPQFGDCQYNHVTEFQCTKPVNP